MQFSLSKTDPTLSENTLKCLEKYLSIKFPVSFRNFLLKFNGGRPCCRLEFNFYNSEDGSVLAAFLGITPQENYDLLNNLKNYQDIIPSNTVPIAYDTFSNLVLLSVKGQDYGKIYFWDHERGANTDNGEVADYSNLTLIADSFEEFISSLKSYEEIGQS